MALTEVNMDLLVALIRHVVTKGANAGQHGASAVLVFMPGLAEITDLFGACMGDAELGDTDRY